MNEKIKVGISTCLLGEPVRYDGGHKLDRFLVKTLGQYVDYVPVCPEVECGLPVPRESMRLVGDPESPRLVTTRTAVDHTERMLTWSARRIRELEAEGLCGFIFKSKSPSSGMERVKVYGEKGVPAKNGVGLFARAFMDHFPLLPVEEEGRLHDPMLRENFIERLFVFRRWRAAERSGLTAKDLLHFHTTHKLLILSHSTVHYRKMGQLLADLKATEIEEIHAQYLKLLMEALTLKATPAKHINVLQHVMGYFKKQLSADEKAELLELFHHYRQGHLPLIVPITLLNHHLRKEGQAYLHDQTYLNPHPVELALRNHC